MSFGAYDRSAPATPRAETRLVYTHAIARGETILAYFADEATALRKLEFYPGAVVVERVGRKWGVGK